MLLALEHPEGPAFSFLVLFVVVLAGPAIMQRARIPTGRGFQQGRGSLPLSKGCASRRGLQPSIPPDKVH